MHPADEGPSHTHDECADVIARLLLEPRDLFEALVSQGWEASSVRPALPAAGGPGTEGDEAERDIVELLGRALWDVFSDNHTVVDANGTAYRLGSFRASGSFIADAINKRYPALPTRYGYLDFYMGGMFVRRGVDRGPVYRWIFSQLRANGCDWIYSFPRIHLIDMRGPEPGARDDGLSYDPSEAVRAEVERAERDREIEALRAGLDEAADETIRRAREEPLPPIVAAYREVFGRLPEGWPHPDM